MSVESYLTFVGASLLLCLAPGPDWAYLLSRCVAQGRKAGVLGALGVNVGAYVHLIAAVSGLSALIMTSAVAFSAVKWLGAAYLVWLGISALRSSGGALKADTQLRGRSARAVFWQGFLSDVLNPKVAMFYLALLPQFVPTGSQRPIADLLLLGFTVNIIGLIVNLGFVLLSARLTEALRRDQRISSWLQRAMGATFLGLGARLAFVKH